jgi:hypothetical protein
VDIAAELRCCSIADMIVCPCKASFRSHGSLGIILLRHGIAEQRHQPVPKLLGDLAAHFHDGGRGGVDI